ncbi:MAG: cytochrome c oxidase accessory protein CcoG, partial [Zoogloeaceae bacterium]|nr:cytochrome c oxidase accessory protein CcoG [Zoogloeaceae bacterium]
GQAQWLGDSIDCNLCVHACPTGIDIRHGLLYECIGCGACIDACDEVMDKVKQPRGLIRYTSENALYGKTHRTSFWSHVLRPRIMVYTAILCVIFGGAVWSFVERVPLRADIIRDRNTLTREVHGMIENLYIIKVMNVSEKPRDFKITVSGLPGIKLAVDSNIVKAEAAENHEVVMSVQVPPDDVSRGAHKIYFEVTAVDDPKVQVKEKSTFLVL